MDVSGVCASGVRVAIYECFKEWVSAVLECETRALVCLVVAWEETDGGCGWFCIDCVFGDCVVEF